jgi:myo-inositol-1(or 4)-monophosphatase
VTDWLAVCRAAVADVEGVLAALPTRHEREPVVGAGLGGDDTTAIDQAAEDAIIARFRDLDVTIVSEEVGRVGNGATLVVVDPIDGSINAKRGIPFFSFSIAIAEGGETMDDVVFGFVHDFGTGEEWTATRGGGAQLNGQPLGAILPKDTLDILAFEATQTELIARDAPKIVGVAQRLRIMGSLALSLCHLAAGRLDGVCSLKGARSVDIAAAQLLVRELGIAIDLFDSNAPFGEAPLDLEGRSRVAAAGSEALMRGIADALSA